MILRDVHWLGERLAAIPPTDLYPVLDIEGGTLESRAPVQAQVDQYIFASAQKRDGKVWRFDLTAPSDVDSVKNMIDPGSPRPLRDRFPARMVVLNNMLNGIDRRFDLAGAVVGALPDGGHLLVCGHADHPYDPAPVDTMFRPTIEEVAAYFPGTRVLGGSLVSPKKPGRLSSLHKPVQSYVLLLQKQPIAAPPERIGVVVIGRNEGCRLARCLRSANRDWTRVVYVDSGSTDESVAMARSMGVEVIELDRARPFTAARGRNAGFELLRKLEPSLKWVQFVDGDCDIQPGWWAAAQDALISRPDFAIVFGRSRERYPEASIYNRLCDMEWNTPVGEREECGGTVLARVAALAQVGGYNPDFIAGEEPEMCVRLHQKGWRFLRIADEMSWHDADMHRFSQWWRREIRGGHAAAEGAATHGHLPGRHRVRQTRRNWWWGLVFPLIVTIAAAIVGPLALLALSLYGLLVFRIYRSQRKRNEPHQRAALYALFCIVSKFPQVVGQYRYWRGRLFSKPSRLIEYKGPLVPADQAPDSAA